MKDENIFWGEECRVTTPLDHDYLHHPHHQPASNIFNNNYCVSPQLPSDAMVYEDVRYQHCDFSNHSLEDNRLTHPEDNHVTNVEDRHVSSIHYTDLHPRVRNEDSQVQSITDFTMSQLSLLDSNVLLEPNNEVKLPKLYLCI